MLRAAHQRNPGDVATSMELADALNAVMRIKTNANSLVIDGSLDTPANKQVWKSLGDEALPLAKQAYDERPGDVKALAVYADSFMFSSSSKGIVKQALSGTATEYKRVAVAVHWTARGAGQAGRLNWRAQAAQGFFLNPPPAGEQQRRVLLELASLRVRRYLFFNEKNRLILLSAARGRPRAPNIRTTSAI